MMCPGHVPPLGLICTVDHAFVGGVGRPRCPGVHPHADRGAEKKAHHHHGGPLVQQTTASTAGVTINSWTLDSCINSNWATCVVQAVVDLDSDGMAQKLPYALPPVISTRMHLLPAQHSFSCMQPYA